VKSHKSSVDKGDKKLVFGIASIDALQGRFPGHSTEAVIDTARVPMYCLIAGMINCGCLSTACHTYHTDQYMTLFNSGIPPEHTHCYPSDSGRDAPEMCALQFRLLSDLVQSCETFQNANRNATPRTHR